VRLRFSFFDGIVLNNVKTKVGNPSIKSIMSKSITFITI
jgi:hypothetical protein